MLKVKFAVAMTVLAVFVLLVVPQPAATAKPVEFRVAYITVVGQLTPLIFVLKGVLKNYGKSYTVNSLHFRGSSPQITAFAAEQLEIGGLAFSSFANAVLNANLPVRIIADLLQDGVKGHSAQTWYVREDSSIRSMSDLKGKTVAINVFGAAVDLMLKVALKKNNLTPGKDVNIVEVKFPNMGPMLQGRKIDVGVIPVSLYFRDIRSVKLRKLFTGREYVGRTQFLMTTVHKNVLEKYPEELADYLEDYLIGLKWYQDPANRDKALDIAERYTKRPRRTMERWAFLPKYDFYRSPDGSPDLVALQKSIDLLAEMKFIKRSFDVKNYTDLGPLRKAQARFKARMK